MKHNEMPVLTRGEGQAEKSGRSDVKEGDGEERWARTQGGAPIGTSNLCHVRSSIAEEMFVRGEEESCYKKRKMYCDPFTRWRRKQESHNTSYLGFSSLTR
jgi:hypothetical protein